MQREKNKSTEQLNSQVSFKIMEERVRSQKRHATVKNPAKRTK